MGTDPASIVRTVSHRAAALLVVALSGCGTQEPSATAPAGDAPPSSAAAEPDLGIHIFDCGRIRMASIVEFGLADTDTPVRELFVPCYLVRHPDGDLLWDAGLPPTMAGGEWIVDDTGAEHFLEAPVSQQLDVVGLTPEDVELIGISHFHYDHSGDANAFAGAELLVQRREHAAAFGASPGASFFFPELYSSLADGPMRLLDGDHDVFGDGRVRILSAPGHTPGHQMLLVELAETGPVLLSGDLWHFVASRRLRSVPTFNVDADQTRAAMTRIEALLEETGATLWLQHSLEQHMDLALAPAIHR